MPIRSVQSSSVAAILLASLRRREKHSLLEEDPQALLHLQESRSGVVATLRPVVVLPAFLPLVLPQQVSSLKRS